ncbi:MAG: universal stress protein [Gammaproteobacteria bacterium]
MEKFRNILFVSQGLTDESDSLKQALSLARNNKAALKALIVCPEFPKEMSDYQAKYEASLTQQLQDSLQNCRKDINVSETEVPVNIEVASGAMPAVQIIRHVLKDEHDLVVKEAEPKEGGKGFKAMDMKLLRKCPCPVWLSRPIKHRRTEMQVAVAIDPISAAPEGHDLSLRLLKLARELADTCNGELNIISCWDCDAEEYLRHNMWIKFDETELRRLVAEAQNQHRDALEDIIQQSGIAGNIQLHQLRGSTEEIIPQYMVDKKFDILVMGTVARTGIPGFVIGNTSENIMQKLQCSLLALKPAGFVSPVKI